MKRCKAVLLSLALLCTLPAFALNIDLLVAQQETDSNIEIGFRSITKSLESVLLDSFFDQGIIVSNQPLAKGPAVQEAIQEGLSGSRKSFMDYYVVVVATYTESSRVAPSSMELGNIENIVVTITDIGKNIVVHEETVIPREKRGEKPVQAVNRLGRELSKSILQKIKASR